MLYPNLSDEEIRKLRDAINSTLGNMKSDIKRKKLKVFGKTVLSLAIVTGGVESAIVFPSLLVLAALGGAKTSRSCISDASKLRNRTIVSTSKSNVKLI